MFHLHMRIVSVTTYAYKLARSDEAPHLVRAIRENHSLVRRLASRDEGSSSRRSLRSIPATAPSKLECAAHNMYPLCGIYYFPWHNHQIEGTLYSYFALIVQCIYLYYVHPYFRLICGKLSGESKRDYWQKRGFSTVG